MMRHLVTIVPDAVLNALGRFESEQLKEETQRMVKQYGLEKHIRFHGHVLDIMPFYLRSSIHVMCSQVEGAPMVLFEAKACRMPSVIFLCPMSMERHQKKAAFPFHKAMFKVWRKLSRNFGHIQKSIRLWRKRLLRAWKNFRTYPLLTDGKHCWNVLKR